MDVLEATESCTVKVEPESGPVDKPDATAANDKSEAV